MVDKFTIQDVIALHDTGFITELEFNCYMKKAAALVRESVAEDLMRNSRINNQSVDDIMSLANMPDIPFDDDDNELGPVLK